MNIDGALKEIDVVKKKIEEETKVSGKLMPEHLGLVVAVVHYCWVQ